MDAIAKLQSFAVQMHLEPAEENPRGAAAARRPVGRRAQSGTRAAGEPLPCGEPTQSTGLPVKKDSLGVHDAVLPGGKRIRLLKTLLTSACERNCTYCPFRAGRNYRRATFKPDEMATVFSELHSAGLVDGLFLSSGIIGGGIRTQDKLLATAELLRRRHRFRGYLHLKIMPGAERAQVERALELSDRVSVNLEAPNAERLQRLAPRKEFLEELLRPLEWVHEIRRAQPAHRAWRGRWPSSSTQFVVGGAGESDVEILTTSEYLYRQTHLARVYYSAFSPVRDTPLENHPPEDPLRQHRLYQSSYLLRDYGFDLEELPFAQNGNLPLATDPKLAWAQLHLAHAPVEVNRASREELLRIPGIGPKRAAAILAARRHGALRDLRDLQALGVAPARAAPFVLLGGKRPPQQLSLW